MSDEFRSGAAVRVKPGVTAPDLPEFSIEGWTGTVTEVSGRKGARRYFIEWDTATLNAMPPDYAEACEQRQLYHLMTCLSFDDIEAA